MTHQLLHNPAIAQALARPLASSVHEQFSLGLGLLDHVVQEAEEECLPVAHLETALANQHERHCEAWHPVVAKDDMPPHQCIPTPYKARRILVPISLL
uniref:Uncharacterized protein n=1 Tax=Arundo donax TaxID=35708 RepID=A0A0A9FP98_ARUDO